MITISDDSIAAALPIAPNEIPTLAKANEGASLMPSPTKATSILSCNSFSKRWYLSWGKRLYDTDSIPTEVAISLAIFSLSPVYISILIPRL